MILGPYFIEEQQTFIRFNVKNGISTAEFSQFNDSEDSIAVWKPIPPNFHVTVNCQNDNHSIPTLFHLNENQVLFRWQNNQWTCVNESMEQISYQNEQRHIIENPSANNQESLMLEMPESDEDKWIKLQNEYSRLSVIESADQDGIFTEDQRSYLLHHLGILLPSLTPVYYPTGHDYLNQLRQIIDNPDNACHENIKTLACKTDFYRNFSLTLDNTDRKNMAEQIKNYLFNVLKKEHNLIAEKLDFQPELRQTNDFIESSSLVSTSFGTIEESVDLLPDNSFKIKSNSNSQAHIDDLVLFTDLDKLKTAVNKALGQYNEPKTFFTAHRSNGRKKAQEFTSQIEKATSFCDAALLVENFVNNPKTNRRDHSFATYLHHQIAEIFNALSDENQDSLVNAYVAGASFQCGK